MARQSELLRFAFVRYATTQGGRHADMQRDAVLIVEGLPPAHQIELIAGGRRQLVSVKHAFAIEKNARQLMAFLQHGLGKLPGAARLLRAIGWAGHREGKTHYLSSPWKSPLLNWRI